MKYTADTLLFPSRVSHFLNVTFDWPELSFNDGLALLSLLDNKLGLTRDLASLCHGWRKSKKVRHDMHQLLSSQVYPDYSYKRENGQALPIFECTKQKKG